MMTAPHAQEVTELLNRFSAGDTHAAEALIPLVHKELQRIAQRCMKHEQAPHTLQPTALVNEAYLNLVQQESPEFADRRHFFGIAGRIMRQLLVNHAKSKQRMKRGGQHQRTPLDDSALAHEDKQFLELLDLDEALNKLEALDPEMVRLIDLRYFAGLTIQETADVLGVSRAKVKRDWHFAQMWLARELK